MLREAVVAELVRSCDMDEGSASHVVDRALVRSGFRGDDPEVGDLRRALPELRRVLQDTVPPTQAIAAVEKAGRILDQSLAPPARSQPVAYEQPAASRKQPSLNELTRQLREANQRLQERDLDGEIAAVEANLVAQQLRRSLLPPK